MRGIRRRRTRNAGLFTGRPAVMPPHPNPSPARGEGLPATAKPLPDDGIGRVVLALSNLTRNIGTAHPHSVALKANAATLALTGSLRHRQFVDDRAE